MGSKSRSTTQTSAPHVSLYWSKGLGGKDSDRLSDLKSDCEEIVRTLCEKFELENPTADPKRGILFIDLDHFPTRILRKLLVKTVSIQDIGQNLCYPAAELSEDMDLHFILIGSDHPAGLPLNGIFPESSFKKSFTQASYRASILYVKIMERYDIAEYLPYYPETAESGAMAQSVTLATERQCVLELIAMSIFKFLGKQSSSFSKKVELFLNDLRSLKEDMETCVDNKVYTDFTMRDDFDFFIKKTTKRDKVLSYDLRKTLFDSKDNNRITREYSIVMSKYREDAQKYKVPLSESPPLEAFLRVVSITDKTNSRSYISNIVRVLSIHWVWDLCVELQEHIREVHKVSAFKDWSIIAAMMVEGPFCALETILHSLLYPLTKSTEEKQAEEKQAEEKQASVRADLIARLKGVIDALRMYRDISDNLKSGALRTLAQWYPSNQPTNPIPNGSNSPEPNEKCLKIMIIDSGFGKPHSNDNLAVNYLAERITGLMRKINMTVDLVDGKHGIRADLNPTPTQSYSLLERDNGIKRNLIGRRWQLSEEYGEFSAYKPLHSILDFDLVFFALNTDYAQSGPETLQWVTALIDREVEQEKRKYESENKIYNRRAPAVIALANDSHSTADIYYSIANGAKTHMLRYNVYQLESQILMALKARDASFERPGQRSNFRQLYGLMPDLRRKLSSFESDRVISGKLIFYNKQKSENNASDRSSYLGYFFPIKEYNWIRILPKADLHCHLGTSISFETIQTLACNSVGYLLDRDDPDLSAEDPSPTVRLWRDVVEVILIANYLLSLGKARAESTAYFHVRVLAEVARAYAIEKGRRTDNVKPVPAHSIGDYIVDLFFEPSIPIEKYQIMCLLVCSLRVFEKDFSKRFGETLAGYFLSTIVSTDDSKIYTDLRESVADLIRSIYRPTQWRGGLTEVAVTNGFDDSKGMSNVMSVIHDRLVSHLSLVDRFLQNTLQCINSTESVGLAERVISKVKEKISNSYDSDKKDTSRQTSFGESLSNLEQHLSLETLVCNPETIAIRGGILNRRDRTLMKYLIGADFLGSDHFQFPENLLLAGVDYVYHNMMDCVIYSEVRAEVTGYTKAGMTANMATRILCASFDLGALWARGVANDQGSPWGSVNLGRGPGLGPFVRTNLLVAAKRHKSIESIRDAITHAIHCLNEPDEELTPVQKEYVPSWWKRARVVGFDLSGDESHDRLPLAEIVSDLKNISAPITIHAGEAADADSIWRAVYEGAARRIGHGLRLREDDQLLQYCVNEGICMEMCPTSNSFTSFFTIPDRTSNQTPTPYKKRHRYYYPLKDYIDVGLSVSINTDNRMLHPPDRRTLTSEYLMAAYLSGGLTKWQILGLIKNGFRHAFLSKQDVADLLSAVEDRIYQLVIEMEA